MIPHAFHHKHTHISIYTIYSNYDTPYVPFITNTHIFIYTLYSNYDTPYVPLISNYNQTTTALSL